MQTRPNGRCEGAVLITADKEVDGVAKLCIVTKDKLGNDAKWWFAGCVANEEADGAVAKCCIVADETEGASSQ
jgi:hypothetical protein